MSDETERKPLQRERDLAVRRKAKEFQEVPGEAEADAMRDAFLKSAGPDPTRQASALASADGATRTNAVNRLQEEQGNAYVQRVVAEAQGTPGRLVGLSQHDMVDEVAQRKGSGTALPEGPREHLAGFMGADLSDVRVHADGEAATLNRELQSQAFTVGHDVFFAEGQYDPTSREGQGLLAHELAHVGQQTGLGQGLQRQAAPEEEEVQTKALQRQAAPEEEEVQTKALQRQAAPEEEQVQTKALQRQAAPEEEEQQAG